MRDQRSDPARHAFPRIDDPDLAAERLTWLGVAPNRLPRQAGAHPHRDDELQAVATQGVATQGVATFMSRYGPEDMEPRQGIRL